MRSVVRISAEIGDIISQSKVLGQLLIELDQENITCWSVKSSPSKVDFIVSQQELTATSEVIQRSLPISHIEFYSCLISFIGTNNREVIDDRISGIKTAELELTYLDSTELSVQYLCNTDDIINLMKSLSNVVQKKSKR